MLLATVIGKHGIFAQFALTAPVAAVLRTLEATIDVSSIESRRVPYILRYHSLGQQEKAVAQPCLPCNYRAGSTVHFQA